jgi:hypothetical protein
LKRETSKVMAKDTEERDMMAKDTEEGEIKYTHTHTHTHTTLKRETPKF